jgi:hypothetical protein
MLRVSSGQPKDSPIRQGATLTNDFEVDLQVLPRRITATALGAAILHLWHRIVAARRLT